MQKTMSTVEMNKMNNSFSISSSRLPKKYTEDKFPICISNRKAYVWDIDHVLDLKMQTSTIFKLAQQNVFLGLPLELMPEEVFSPAKSGIAIFIDEKQAHCAPTLEEASLFKAKEDTRIANDIRILTLREAERQVAMKDQYCSEIELTDMNQESQKSYISAVKCLTRKPSLYQDVPQQSYLSSSQPQLYVASQGPHIQLSSSSSSSVLPETTRDGGTDDNCIDHQQLHCDPIDPEYILGSPTLEMVRYSHPQFINTDEQRDQPGCNNNSLNHNQHQQHLPTSSTMAKKLIMASFVQTRGIVPIFWTEIYNLRYKPDLKIMDVPQTFSTWKLNENNTTSRIYEGSFQSTGQDLWRPVLGQSERNFDKTNSLPTEALTLQTGNGELRALYTYFLIESNQLKQARDFAVETLKDHDKQYIYALCASAHGLAIALEEHALGPGGPAAYNANPISSASESSVLRVKNLCDSIAILNKVREALNDGRVYVNLGHCHYLRDKFERSIENVSA
ncbi:hypothetical protein PPACK8108_LOCUS11515 [Phakopsora pachyrhizi]|uniref:SAC domain-containing protein n=1 Tax=Phakopsora pachyrhizi TaxID=170000 RepID=A0AAV0B089_PHAPC|nr:hypothetical protein PPACK8108_LOCUS11515 [Phakopsora pachyrhizi]